jgi:hypothetical protein
MPSTAPITKLDIPELELFSPEWAECARAEIDAGPEPATLARKIPKFWDWIAFVKPQVTCVWGLGCRDLPGDGPNAVLFTMEAGVPTSVEVTSIEDARTKATFLQVGDLEGWRDLMAGYDVGKTVMYRKLMMDTGSVLDFFKFAYFWTESLACVQRVPTRLPLDEPAGV